MSAHADAIHSRLAGGPQNARQLIDSMAISQPTLSRALAELGDDIVRIGSGRSIQYALRAPSRSLPDIPIHQVDAEGHLARLGTLIPVRPDGFVMRDDAGNTRHSDSLPWWLTDMRPQGYLGRAYATRHGAALGLPARLADWTDSHALRALLAQGHDLIGNLLLGEVARDRFLAAALPKPIPETHRAERYAQLAAEASRGEAPGSSAGGEQPKFTACVMTPGGPRHVIVKFSEPEQSPVSERWCDLLLVEHLALATLRDAGLPAARTRILDHGGQRFLEVERFDRVGLLGRRAQHSLAALEAEFVGAAPLGWPELTRRLAADGLIQPQAAADAQRLWAFGTLIGNTDMHNGNLSFIADDSPYQLAPAYDMTAMALAPRSGGGLPNTIPEVALHASVENSTWRHAEELSRDFLTRVRNERGFSQRFTTGIAALERHVATVGGKIGRLA